MAIVDTLFTGTYVGQYNTKRLHSAIGYIAPKDKLEGRAEVIHAEEQLTRAS